MWTHRNAVTVRNPAGGLVPASVPRSRLDVVGEALGGISAELDALEWDWRERSAEERALDERYPLVCVPPQRVEFLGMVDGEFRFVVRDA